MHFNYPVKPTKEFIFIPDSLDIYIGAAAVLENGTEIVNVQTVLTQTTPGGTIVETKNHQFPVSMLQPAIGAFKLGESKPEIDIVKLGQLLSPFNLQLHLPDTGC